MFSQFHIRKLELLFNILNYICWKVWQLEVKQIDFSFPACNLQEEEKESNESYWLSLKFQESLVCLGMDYIFNIEQLWRFLQNMIA